MAIVDTTNLTNGTATTTYPLFSTQWFINGNFAGIPIPFIIVLLLIIVIFYLILTRKTNTKFEGLDIKKETNSNMNRLYEISGISARKLLMVGPSNSGYVLGTMPILWNRKIKIKDNLNNNKYRELKEQIAIELDKDGKTKPTTEYKEELYEMIGLKTCGSNIISRTLAIYLGAGIKWIIVDKRSVSYSENLITIDPMVIPEIFLGITIFSKAARYKVENISFRINRENELKEIADQIPKQRYFENQTGAWIAKVRENAEIENKKWAAQREGAQD